MALGEKAKGLADRAGELADKATDAAATGVEKVAETLDGMTGGLFEEKLAETSGKAAETLRRVGSGSEDE